MGRNARLKAKLPLENGSKLWYICICWQQGAANLFGGRRTRRLNGNSPVGLTARCPSGQGWQAVSTPANRLLDVALPALND